MYDSIIATLWYFHVKEWSSYNYSYSEFCAVLRTDSITTDRSDSCNHSRLMSWPQTSCLALIDWMRFSISWSLSPTSRQAILAICLQIEIRICRPISSIFPDALEHTPEIFIYSRLRSCKYRGCSRRRPVEISGLCLSAFSYILSKRRIVMVSENFTSRVQ